MAVGLVVDVPSANAQIFVGDNEVDTHLTNLQDMPTGGIVLGVFGRFMNAADVPAGSVVPSEGTALTQDSQNAARYYGMVSAVVGNDRFLAWYRLSLPGGRVVVNVLAPQGGQQAVNPVSG